MSRKGGLPDKSEAANLPCSSVTKPKSLDLQFSTVDQAYRFAIETSKWPYPDSLSVSFPVTEKNILGTESKLEIVRVAHPRMEEYVIKGPDSRAVRYASEQLEDLFRSATATHRIEFVQIEKAALPSSYIVYLGRPQRDGRALSVIASEERVNTLVAAFEVKTAKDLEGKGFDSVLRDPAEALSLYEIHAQNPAYTPPASSVLVHGLAGWISTGSVSEDWLRSVRGKMSESDKMKIEWKKKMRGEKTEAEAMKEEWQKKMKGEQVEASKTVIPSNPLAAVDQRTRTTFLRLFGSSNTASMDSLKFLLHNSGTEMEAFETEAPPFRIRSLVSKEKPRRLLVWNEWDIRIMSEGELRSELLGQKEASKPRSSKEVSRDSNKDKEKEKKEKKSGKKIETSGKQHRSKKGSGSGHKKD